MKLWQRLATGAAVALSFSANAHSQLTIYTYSSFVSDWGPGPALTEQFEKDCHCELNWVALDDGVSILNRLKLEKQQAKADVILGLDTNLMPEARQLGAVAKHQLELPKLAIDWQEDDFIPFDYGNFAFVYNSETLTEPPSSMQELLESFSGTVIYQDPRTSTPGQGLMLWLKALYPDNTGEAWQQLKGKTVTVAKGWSEAYGMFLNGEADMVLSYTTSPAYHQVAEKDTKYKAASFSEGHMQQVEVAAVAANAAQPELAKRFLQFLLTKQAQEIIALNNWMLPVNPEAQLPAAFDGLADTPTLSIQPEQVSQQRQSWTKEWRKAVSQ